MFTLIILYNYNIVLYLRVGGWGVKNCRFGLRARRYLFPGSKTNQTWNSPPNTCPSRSCRDLNHGQPSTDGTVSGTVSGRAEPKNAFGWVGLGPG